MDDNSGNFEISRISLTEQVCDLMKHNLTCGLWKVGEKIPSEGQLAEMFKVNKLTIRIAIQKLNAMGILETRTGSGTFVISFDFNNYIKEVYDFYIEPELIENISEYRQTIEITCARLAIERATVKNLEEFAKLFNEYEQIKQGITEPLSDEDFSKIAQADIAFHRHICKMSHNKLFIYAFAIAEQSLYEYMLMLNKERIQKWQQKGFTSTDILFSKDTHKEIYQAILDKDYERCKAYYIDMINPSAEW